MFHDVKEVWGSGQQQVRNLWANIAAWHVNGSTTLVELWAWDRPAAETGASGTRLGPQPDRRRRPRRPPQSPAGGLPDARILDGSRLPRPLTRKFRTLLTRLLRITV
ncbi:MAG: hypothetical protein R3B90_00620 [Planctomycetaceae bacterium]